MRRLCLLFLWVTCTQPGCSRTASENAMLRANPTPDAAFATDVAAATDAAPATDAARALDVTKKADVASLDADGSDTTTALELTVGSPVGPPPADPLAGSGMSSCALYLGERCESGQLERCEVYAVDDEAFVVATLELRLEGDAPHELLQFGLEHVCVNWRFHFSGRSW